MALQRAKKEEIVAELVELINNSKLTVVANYQGMTVKNMQELRKLARQNGTIIKIVKNRLVKKAFSELEDFKSSDTSSLMNMLMYVFNPEDEVAGPQTVKQFTKNVPKIKFVGAYTVDGQFMSPEDVDSLADLPTKDILRGQLVGTLSAPLTGYVGVLSANLTSVINLLNNRAKALN